MNLRSGDAAMGARQPTIMKKPKKKLSRRPAPVHSIAAHCYAAPLDLTHPDANMYGCFPCPVCKSNYRWPTQQGTARCDDCGLVQELEKTEQHNAKPSGLRE